MAKLPRVLQKIFGLNATPGAVGVGQISVFGSAGAGAPATTTDPAVIQSLPQYLTGWFAAILGPNTNVVEDRNALDFLFSRQIAQIFEDGIPQWEANTTYYSGSIVKQEDFVPPGVPANNPLYMCVVSSASSSLGNDPISSPSFWRKLNFSGLNPQANLALTARAASAWVTSTPTAGTYLSVAYSPELKVLVAVGGAANPVMSSADGGVTWTDRVMPAGMTSALSVAWSPSLGLFCAVASFGIATKQVMTSPDGVTWTSRTVTTANASYTAIAWSDELGMFCIVGRGGVVSVTTSTDGITWTDRVVTSHNIFSAVAWSPSLSLWVAVCSDNAPNQVITSPDGITWTAQATPVSGTWDAVCWSEDQGTFVAVSVSGLVMTSRDGILWVQRVAASASSWNSVAYSPQLGLFVAVSGSGIKSNVMTSPDGVTWTLHVTTNTNAWTSICWATEFGTFVSVANSGANLAMRSTYVKKFIF